MACIVVSKVVVFFAAGSIALWDHLKFLVSLRMIPGSGSIASSFLRNVFLFAPAMSNRALHA